MNFFSFLIIFLIPFIQIKDNSKVILDKVKANFSQVKDYEVDVDILINVEFLKIPNSKAKIFFKQPDKIKINSEGFALIPKEGLNFSPHSFLDGEFTSIYERDETIEGVKTAIIKIIPLGNNSDIILSTLWIDLNKYVIMKVESTTKTKGTFTIELFYEKEIKYSLPIKMIFSFDMKGIDLPSFGTDDKSKDNKKKLNKAEKGSVIINYSNYKINKGIDDSLFEEKK